MRFLAKATQSLPAGLAVAMVVSLASMAARCRAAQSHVASERVEDEKVLDAFEGEQALAAWRTRERAVVSLSDERASHGVRSMRFESPGGTDSPSAVRRLSTHAGETDWSGYDVFAFDVFNPSTSPQQLRLRLYDTDDGQHTSQHRCEPGRWTSVIVQIKSVEGLHLSRMRQVRFYLAHPKDDVVLFLDNLRLYNEPVVLIEATRRTSFRRMEANAEVELTVTNRGENDLAGGRLDAALDGCDAQLFDLPLLAPGARSAECNARSTPGYVPTSTGWMCGRCLPETPRRRPRPRSPYASLPGRCPLRMRTFMLWGDMSLDMLEQVGLNTFTPGQMADTTMTWEAAAPHCPARHARAHAAVLLAPQRRIGPGAGRVFPLRVARPDRPLAPDARILLRWRRRQALPGPHPAERAAPRLAGVCSPIRCVAGRGVWRLPSVHRGISPLGGAWPDHGAVL